jgi:hypothetical protein
MTAFHPIPATKKTLSYMIRLCQPSSWLFEYVDKKQRPPGLRVCAVTERNASAAAQG